MKRVLAIATVVITLCSAGPAAANTRLLTRGEVAAGPAWAGDAVVYGQRGGGLVLLSGGHTRLLRGAYFAPFSSDGDGYSYAIHEAEVHGSPEAVAARSTFRWGNRGYDSYVEDEYFAGLTPAAGPVFTTAGGMRPDYTAQEAFGLDGQRVAFVPAPGAAIVVRDLSTGAADDGTGRRERRACGSPAAFLPTANPARASLTSTTPRPERSRTESTRRTRLSSGVPMVPW